MILIDSRFHLMRDLLCAKLWIFFIDFKSVDKATYQIVIKYNYIYEHHRCTKSNGRHRGHHSQTTRPIRCTYKARKHPVLTHSLISTCQWLLFYDLKLKISSCILQQTHFLVIDFPNVSQCVYIKQLTCFSRSWTHAMDC